MQNIKKYLAEFLGTAVLVLFGCGSAVLTGNLIVIAITFGLAIIIGAYGIASASGCHINPAVSLAMLINGKMSFKDFCAYVAAQIAGAFAGSGLLYAILSCTNRGTDNLGANGYEALSTTGITMSGAILVEIILTFVFIYVILSVTAKVIMFAGFLVTIASLADPVITRQEKVYTSLGIDIVFAVDTSPSMAAKDIGGASRLESAKETIRNAAVEYDGCRFGIVVFDVAFPPV